MTDASELGRPVAGPGDDPLGQDGDFSHSANCHGG